MEKIPSRTFSAMMQYLRGGGMSHIIPESLQKELPKILNAYLYGDQPAKPKATHSAWLGEDMALKALHNCGYWADSTTKPWEEPRIPPPGENDVINEVILEMRRAKTRNPPAYQEEWASRPVDGRIPFYTSHDSWPPKDHSWWRSKEAHSVGGIEEDQFKRFAERDLQLDRQAGIETLVALSEAELQQAIIEGRRRFKEREKHS